ncbi:hypothetical protein [Methylorubrum extorquens]|uniref:Uncharacterized protein n=1 Tax=Methylorubrum extorquens TaxID=408 RepID=A0AAX3WKM4_METEX|nr:hypothetical protein [Methylorubrum extorquens]WHQ72058.1 hypothetical protein KEC54_11210 [Methylorubrum extorquens]
MARPTLPASDMAAHRAWIAETIQAPFHRPRELARLVHPKAEPTPPTEKAPDLVDMMEAPPALADEKPWYIRERLPLAEMLRAHFGGTISPPTPVAEKRLRLKRERAEAAARAAQAEVAPTEEEAAADTPAPPTAPRTPLAEKRLRLRRERAEAALAKMDAEYEEEAEMETLPPEPTPEPEALPPASEASPAPAGKPALGVTFDMGFWTKAHAKDRIVFEPALGMPHRVACPPFHLHDEEHADPVDPVDEFLGQVIGVEHGRALLFRRRDPDVMDGCDVGGLYVAMRFWRDDTGKVWSMPVRGDDADAVRVAVWRTQNLYRRNRGGSG